MTKNTWVAVAVSIGVVGFFLFGGTVVNLFTSIDNNQTASINTMNNDNNENQLNELIVQDELVGEGEEAVNGSLVSVNYVGMFENGQKFDASADHGKPFEFVLGQGNVIKGWDTGVLGMKVGGKRILVVPPGMGYGNQQVGPIPPNSTLIFQVELLSVQKPQ
jgi:FKBP-type peptidyl-prolyl cis-trans isomerase